MTILIGILGTITSLVDTYNKLKALWATTLTPEQKTELAAKEDALFASPAWRLSGLK